MKTKEELNALKEEFKALNKKLAELTEEELAQVSGGVLNGYNKHGLEPDVLYRTGHVSVSERPAL